MASFLALADGTTYLNMDHVRNVIVLPTGIMLNFVDGTRLGVDGDDMAAFLLWLGKNTTPTPKTRNWHNPATQANRNAPPDPTAPPKGGPNG